MPRWRGGSAYALRAIPTSRDLRVAPCDARTCVDQRSIADPGAAGLSTAEAEELLAREGPNEVAVHTRATVLRQLVSSASNPLLGILLVCAVASAMLGQRVNATIVVSMVLLSATIDFVQSFRSARAVERLRAQVAPTATVLRDGRWVELPRRVLVPGDRIRLSAGDMVPADARLVSARTVHVVEAALTGESLPVEKEVGALADGGTVSAGRVYAGTSIASGSAEALVERTGGHTQLGMIAARLAEHPPQTAFEHGIRDFGLFITRTVLFLVLFIGVVSVTLHRPPLESLLFAVALAVGLTPEFLPMISTVTLAAGAMRMARAKVIVKHLPAIQNLGQHRRPLQRQDRDAHPRRRWSSSGRWMARGRRARRSLELARVNSALQTGLRSPLDDAILAAAGEAVGGWRRQDEVPFDFERRRLSVAAERDGSHGSWSARGRRRACSPRVRPGRRRPARSRSMPMPARAVFEPTRRSPSRACGSSRWPRVRWGRTSRATSPRSAISPSSGSWPSSTRRSPRWRRPSPGSAATG